MCYEKSVKKVVWRYLFDMLCVVVRLYMREGGVEMLNYS